MVKQNSKKLSLLESGKKEFLTTPFLAEKLGKQVVFNNDNAEQSFKDETDPNKVVSNKDITHKEVAKMLANVITNDTFKKKGHALKYMPKMDLVPYLPKF